MKSLALACLCGTLAGTANGTEFVPEASSAEAAIEALPMVAAALSGIEVSSARADALARGPYGFQINVMPTVRHERHGPTYSEWEASLSHPWRLPGKERIDRAIGAVGQEAADLAVEDARHIGARLLLERWFRWLRDAASANLAARHVANLREQRAAIALRVERGDLAALDLDRADAAVAQAEVTVERSQLSREQARSALAQQFPSLVVPAAVPAIPVPPAPDEDEAVIVQRILSRSHEIALAEAATRRQGLLADRAAADRHPDPSVGVRFLDEVDSTQHAVGLVFSIPLAGRGQAATALAETRLISTAEAEAAAVAQTIELEARQLAQARARGLQTWQATKRALLASTAALQRMERAWQLGEVGFADVALARRDQQDAEQTEQMARIDALETQLLIEIDSHRRWVRHGGEPASG